MARKTSPQKPGLRPARRGLHRVRSLRAGLAWFALVSVLAVLAASLVHRVLPPSPTFYMKQEAHRLGGIDHAWVPISEVAPVMARAVVAAEDANFCLHWGFDMRAIRAVIERGETRGASTLSQQTVKNVYLWQERTWVRKALEAMMTPVIEAMWSKRRIIEVYLNIAEFDEGIFGIDAAAHHYFGVNPSDLSALQAARLAAVLPNPKERSASKPSNFVRERTAAIMDGAATIRRDGRSACFED
ncbi:monofunctional biosynthetic peptidoglycan transglycosylase [Roseovarius sp. LXJ103]|uniref:monofunctional biosynthetic peptidoglycan transglycosylase n=1 Tax=Roseovarius carneus TaxID=2853164 RepID=UPI000D619351|nr:monofunctional biosynthetic peptidoglycan transglycosylase [Roseovarius carneus]MBZ8117999.1 monofunctional biosynthetic peptidoglycan transglycosylase [Roseovarius carneus]PWE36252.1 monofunctional biosynthetic peptidoglycan transglycosylase [Pelagicola sp. LXJ1103]